MNRETLIARKTRIDERLGRLKTQLRDWRREAAATRKFRPLTEIRDLETEIVRLGQRSQRLQEAIGALSRADKRGSNAWFEIAAREILARDVFCAILDHAKELRMDSLEKAGFSSDLFMADEEVDED